MELGIYTFAERTPDPSTSNLVSAHQSVGTMPHEKVMHSIELFGIKVAPVIRKEIA